MRSAAGLTVLATLLWLADSSNAFASGRPSRAETNREVATTLARQLLAAAILPLGTGESGASRQALSPALELDHPMESLGSGDLIDVHQFWVINVPAEGFVTFALANPPHGTKLTEGQHGSTDDTLEQNLWWTDQSPPKGVETAVLEYSLYPLGPETTGLRLDSQVIWLPIRTRETLVPSSDRLATISLDSLASAVGIRSRHLGSGARLSKLVELVNRLPTEPPNAVAFGCEALTTAYDISFRAKPGSPSNAEVKGQIGCVQLTLREGGHQIQLKQAALVSEILALLDLTQAELDGPETQPTLSPTP
jgi:hypothetical protein